MSANVVEQKATSALSNALLTKEKLILPNISALEKTPLYDGNILVYTASTQKKSDLYKSGHVAMQIKGTEQSITPYSRSTHSISLIDLDKYFSAGGLVFFKVYLNLDNNSNRIYFANLLPYVIKGYLEKAKRKGNEKEITIDLHLFPMDFQSMYTILTRHIDDKEKQMSIIGTSLTLEDLEKNFLDGDFSFTLSFNKDGSIINSELNNPIFMYSTNKEGLTVPMHSIHPDRLEMKPNDVVIKINDKIVFKDISYISEKGKKKSISLGENNIVIGGEKENNFRYNVAGNLDDQIGTIVFLKELLNNETSTLYVDDIRSIEFPNISVALKGVKIDEEYFSYLKNLKCLMNILKIDTPLCIDSLTQKEKNDALVMYHALVLHEEIALENQTNRLLFSTVSLAKTTFLIVFIKNDISEKYKAMDFFGVDILNFNVHSVFEDIEFDTTIFHMLTKEHFCSLSNIDYQLISSEVKKRESVDLYLSATNNLLLDIISAYDNIRNPESLNCAIDISRWLSENSDDTIYLLNYFQCILRKRDLKQEEKNQLHSLQGKTDLRSELAVSLILQDRNRFNYIKSQLESENRQSDIKELLSHPIGNLIKRLK